MNIKTNSTLFHALFSLLIIFLFLPQSTLGAENTGNCHCFRNRTFNPADKFIADDYILATTFNSLLASEFDISKREIIMMKMRDGIANSELMTAFYIAKETESDTKQLIKMRKKLSWQEIVRPILENSPQPKVKENLSFIQTSTSDEQIAEHITQVLITSRFSPSQDELKNLQEHNLSAKQIVLAFTLGNHAGISVDKIIDQYLNQGRSWSEIAYNLGLQPADAGKLLENVSSSQ